ncbi:uncharacterized protein LOC116273300 [Papio anubis]|uniref:uncharacterized protein LOC116273300 n=1 Tax=Papio anubis TaxID=9555 RepID=UPI0012AE229F|nr:uncharacterized protein LOC116273300 [Papio anubis]
MTSGFRPPHWQRLRELSSAPLRPPGTRLDSRVRPERPAPWRPGTHEGFCGAGLSQNINQILFSQRVNAKTTATPHPLANCGGPAPRAPALVHPGVSKAPAGARTLRSHVPGAPPSRRARAEVRSTTPVAAQRRRGARAAERRAGPSGAELAGARRRGGGGDAGLGGSASYRSRSPRRALPRFAPRPSPPRAGVRWSLRPRSPPRRVFAIMNPVYSPGSSGVPYANAKGIGYPGKQVQFCFHF